MLGRLCLGLMTCTIWVVACDAAEILPARYLELIRHENYTAVETLADAEIGRAEEDTKKHPERLCQTLEQRVRIDFFDTRQPITMRQKTLERALQCRQGLGDNVENAARIAWLQGRLAALAADAGDAKRGAALLAEAAPRIAQYRKKLGEIDYAMAAIGLANAADAGSDLPGAYRWTHAGTLATAGHGALERMIHSQLLTGECFTLGRLGRFSESEVAGKAAVELSGQMFGVPSPLHATALAHLGQVQFFAHHFADAEVTLGHAIEDNRQLGPGARRGLANTLSVWGNLQRQTGSYDRGRAALTEAVAIERSNTSGGQSGLPAKLTNLGMLEAAAGHCDAAIAPLREAAELVRQRRGPDSDYLIPVLGTLGQCELAAGQIGDARGDASQALAIAGKAWGEHNPQIAEQYLNLARLDLAANDYAVATERLQHALTVLPADRDTLGATRISIERNLARSLHGAHNDAAAFEHAVVAETARQRLLQHFAAALDESGALNLRENQPGGLDQLLALAAARHDPAWIERAWQLQIGSRALITRLVSARLKTARDSADPQTRTLWEKWTKANGAYTAALLVAEAGKVAKLGEARDALDEAERALAQHIHGVGESAILDTAALRASLPEHSALVAFAADRADAWADDRIGGPTRAHRYYAFKLGGDAAPALIELGDADNLVAAIRAWTEALRDPARPDADVDALGKEVARLVWQPLDLPDDVQHVFIVPEGDLHRVAWLALPLHAGLLVEHGPVPQLLDSERELVVAAPASARPARPLLVGDVPLDPALATADCGNRLHVLPGARRELDALSTLWQQTGGSKATYLAGRDATIPAVRAAMSHSSLIHFATHAFSEDNDCTRNLLAARGLHVVNATQTAAPSVSGLLLASDAKAQSSDRNGLLAAPEVAALNLDGVDTVTLAACDTGTGTVHADEGVFGLARAFRLAGARSVVMSLWNVNDAATAELMQHMYRARWLEHMSLADALAGAARATLVTRRAHGESTHPYYWAAFGVTGEWR